MVVAETDRLTLRRWTADDLEAMFDIYRHREVTSCLGGAGQPVADVDATGPIMERALERYDQLEFGLWAMELKASAAVIGSCGLNRLVDGGVEIAYHLNPAHWRRGLATEAAGATLELGFGVYGLSRIVGLIFPTNHASRRVLEKIGMAREGSGSYYGCELDLYSSEAPG